MARLALLGVLLVGPAAAVAGEEMAYVFNAPESDRDVRYTFQWEILRAALERTTARWGPYRLVPSERMSEHRQVFELESGSGKLTVLYLDDTPELEGKLHPIRIPVDRGLVGYRVFLIRREDRGRYERTRTVEDLRRIAFGLGLGWSDVGVLRASGLKVVTGSSYEGLFEMLIHRRFDVFLRAATEVVDEVEQRQAALPDLFIEENLLLHYPLPMYFWFARSEQGGRLAARAEEGMRAMIADGTYDAIFDKHYRRSIRQLRLVERRMIRLPNSQLAPETPFGDRRLWFDPATYR